MPRPAAKPVRSSKSRAASEAEVTYRFPDTPNADWTDRLKLVPEGDKLLVDDILFANVANGEPDQGLRLVLFNAFDQ